MIKGIIDLHGLKMPGIVGQEFLISHARRVEWSDPVRVMPTGGAYEDVSRKHFVLKKLLSRLQDNLLGVFPWME